MKKKNIILSVCILLLLAILLWLAQCLLTPKYMSAPFLEGALIGEYYNESPDHDVLFLGDCEVYESFTPPTLWEEYGITSYIRGSGQQLIWHSYYLLEEMLERETPHAVVYNVYAMKYGTPQDEAYNRMTLDGMRWSSSKVAAIGASMTEEETFLSYVFPLLRFHSRWSDLTAEDVTYMFHRDRVSHNGYLMQTGVKPMTTVREPHDFENDLPDASFAYLDKMHALCKEKGVELILIKAPTNSPTYHWYDEWEEQIVAYAEENGLAYYNFIPKGEEIGLDWSRDTYDAGLHLNVSGAEKLTSYFGRILSEEHGLEDRRGETETAKVWNEKLRVYCEERDKSNGGAVTQE